MLMHLVTDSITEQIYRIIKEKILLTDLKMGEQINPRELASEFNVSVMPVRDALRRLVNEGLVVNKARVGFFVRSFTRREIQDIMEVRRLYELYCLDQYFHELDREKLREILDACRETETLSRRHFDELDEAIHELIITASHNDYLIESYHNVKNQIIICRHLDRDRMEVAHGEHIRLLEAILAGKKEEAVEILRSHINRVAEAIL
ncbi:MAG: GntR family transcriptional regulator [Desulfacinum sp.]|nr:GntR family transcriptional regulator [Desulfacinum sp.]MBC7360150.1 GntR family transcriptional regulator [Desulfacinum sp.]